MQKINKIGVLYGGSSSEREISIQSGEGVHKAILDLGYNSDLIEFNNFFLCIHLFLKAISSRQAILKPCRFSIAATKEEVS